jgi:hypothetical protein
VCINLERTEYHAVDAGFWVAFGASHPVDQISNQSDRFISLGNVRSFFMNPESAVQPYSIILLHE